MQVIFLETDLQKGRNDIPDGVHSMNQGHRWTKKGGVDIGNSESSILAREKYIDWSNRGIKESQGVTVNTILRLSGQWRRT